jgi:hypothetical protein
MTRQIRGLIRFSMGLLVGLALMTSCGSDQAPEVEVGQVQLSLQTTSVEGVDFWLRGCFEVTGYSYPQGEVVCTQDYAENETAINLSVKSGDYQVFLQDGWSMDYSAGGQPLAPVDPASVQLISPNPQTVQVLADQVTQVVLRFQVEQTVIDFGLGTLSIVPDVQVTGTSLVFVTETAMTGNLGPASGEAIGNANAICQSEADAAGLHGTFWAWLSNTAGTIYVPNYNPAGWWSLSMAGRRLFRTDGAQIAASWEDLLAEGPSVPIMAYANGTRASGLSIVWTGTLNDGAVGGLNCSQWTVEGMGTGDRANIGNFSAVDSWSYTGSVDCGYEARLYCFQVPDPAP